MTRTLVTVLLCAAMINTATAQKTTNSYQQTWLAYLNQTRFSDKWGAWLDLHLRTRDEFVNNVSQVIIRPGITYYASNNTKLTLGYAYVNSYPLATNQNQLYTRRPEHRPWQQVQWHTNYPRLRLMQWFRLEERYRHKINADNSLADGYNFNFRLRYNFLLAVPLSAKPFAPNTLSAILNNEIHVNFGKEIVNNYFDQNRFFVGLSYHTTKTDNLQFGYMYLFQQLASGNQYNAIHAIRIFYFHNLDLR